MTTLDDKLLPKVIALLAKYGINTTFTVVTGAYDPTTANRAAGSTDHTVKATPPTAYRTHEIDGDLIRAGDLRLTIAGSGAPWTPAVGNTVAIGGVSWRIVGVRPMYSGASVAAWELQARR